MLKTGLDRILNRAFRQTLDCSNEAPERRPSLCTVLGFGRPTTRDMNVEEAASIIAGNQKLAIAQNSEVEFGRYSQAANVAFERMRYEILSPNISLVHARIGTDGTGLYIVDVGTDGKGSKHGTFVNGEKIRPGSKHYLRDNDEIWLGLPNLGWSEKIIVERSRKPLNHNVPNYLKLDQPAQT